MHSSWMRAPLCSIHTPVFADRKMVACNDFLCVTDVVLIFTMATLITEVHFIDDFYCCVMANGLKIVDNEVCLVLR